MKCKQAISFLIVLLLLLCFCLPALAEEVTTADTETTQANTTVVEIYNYNDLLQIQDDPQGTYKLMADIDLADVIWEPLNFSGTLDGNGHAILNVMINQVTSQTRKTYDGNMNEYDTAFCGFFGILENATVSGLDLLGVKISVNSNDPCFIGGIAGYMDASRISDCTIEGEASLYTKAKSFGVGGIAGFGNGQIENSSSDMTLISVDEDAENPDEQFMGGAYAVGYIDLNKNDIKISGYDSDHGYVHDGGLIGMYILYKSEEEIYHGYVTNNKISGFISFFEDNEDRRAYCEPVAGEVMNWTFADDGNEDDFTADEHFEYDVNLLPHYCVDPEYQDVIEPSTCSTYGHTTHNCLTCGEYSYRSDYTLPDHEVETWTVTIEPTAEEEGVRQGSCTKCGNVIYERVPVVAAGQTADAEAEDAAVTETGGSGSAGKTILIIVIILIVIIAVFYFYIRIRNAQIKRQKAARRAAQQKAARKRAMQQRALEERAAGQRRRPQSGQERRPQQAGRASSPRPSDQVRRTQPSGQVRRTQPSGQVRRQQPPGQARRMQQSGQTRGRSR